MTAASFPTDRVSRHWGWLLGAAVVVAAAMASVIEVPESQQAVVVRAGKPVAVINPYRAGQALGQGGFGLALRIPLVDHVERIDKRLLSIDMEQQQVLSTDQQRLNVDAYARFRVIDPVKMVLTAGTTDRVADQLEPILTSVLRQELGNRTFQSLLTAERGQAMENIRKGLDREARQYGAQVVDVRIKRADLPDSALQSAFDRMGAARQEEAKTIAAEGQKDAQIIRADADAQASAIYAKAFGQDPQFYDFYRAMQSYDYAFSQDDSSATILLSPDSAYLKHFEQP